MKLIFAGTPPFAAAALLALREAGHDIALVLSQPDRPAGRGLKLMPSAVATEASRLGLPIEKPLTLKDPAIQARLRDVEAEVMIVAAYGLLLPQALLDIPKRGCINIHGSLLPRWRGAAPVQRAIEAGDKETGIAIMQMDAGLDTGAVLLESRLPIESDETSASLFEKMTRLGAHAIVEALENLSRLKPRAQSSEGITYARKIEKSEARIDWSRPAVEIERRLRAFDPFPGCEANLKGQPVKLWRGQVIEKSSGQEAGTIIDADAGNLIVQCGEGQLQWKIVQKPGGKRMMIDEFMRGNAITKGTRL